MELICKDFKVTGNGTDLTLYRKYMKKDKETKEETGEVGYSFVGYYPKFDMLVRGAIHNELGQDVKTVEEINQLIMDVSNQFKDVVL